MGWATEEFGTIDLGDKRLNKRAAVLVERLAEQPTASIPTACRGWAETQAAYRFLGQEDIDWTDIMKPHWQCSAERMSQHKIVLCLQDTTELDFNGQETEGLGPLSYEAQRGMYLHATLAVTTAREPLGVLDAWMWAREAKDADGVRGGVNESRRWIEGYERLTEQAATLPGVKLVYVADREADIKALMVRAHEQGNAVDWLIRSKYNRSLPDGDKLWSRTLAGEALGCIEFLMPSREGQKARKVRQHVWAERISLPDKQHGALDVTCVVAREVDAPPGVKSIEWRLVTNREVADFDDAVELIDWYRSRWEIEMFFHVLKNGCKVEELQLSSIDRVQRALALFMVVSWRIGYLMRLGRTCPELPAELLFDRDEWIAAYVLNKKRPPAEPPVLNEVIRLIALLGGFLGRKHDGDPGVKAIWTGLHRVMDSAQTLRNLRELGLDPKSCV